MLFFNFLSAAKTNVMGANCTTAKFEQLREAIANQCAIGEAYWDAHPTIKFIEYYPELVEEMSFKQRNKKSFNVDRYREIKNAVNTTKNIKKLWLE